MDYKDYYAVLGVPRSAPQGEIKKAFRKLARTHHPDAKPGDKAAERRFKEVNEANAVLSDKDKRALYDRLGSDWEAHARSEAKTPGASGSGSTAGRRRAPTGGFAGYGGSSGGNVRYEFHSTGEPGEYSDFFNAYFGGASEPLTDQGPGRGRRATGGQTFEDILAGLGLHGDAGQVRGPGTAAGTAPRLASVEATAEITLDEAYHGTTRLVEVEGKRLEITIPPGADTGTRIRLTGKGPGGGHLFVVVRQTPDSTFSRRGDDLERELPLTLSEALLGADVKVRTPKGRVILTIPAGTQTGRTFRLRGQGMPRFQTTGHGDLFAKARVLLPTDLSDETRAAARTFLDHVHQPDPRARET